MDDSVFKNPAALPDDLMGHIICAGGGKAPMRFAAVGILVSMFASAGLARPTGGVSPYAYVDNAPALNHSVGIPNGYPPDMHDVVGPPPHPPDIRLRTSFVDVRGGSTPVDPLLPSADDESLIGDNACGTTVYSCRASTSLLHLSSWPSRLGSAWAFVSCDHAWYFSDTHFAPSVAMFALGAAFAHTGVDGGFRTFWQDKVRSRTTNRMSTWAKPIGEGYYVIAGAGAVWLADRLLWGYRDSPYAAWGDNCVRALVVGSAPMLLAQWVTGASRPLETSRGPRWRPFADVNGVSGHAFVGAIPFITAAKLCQDWRAKALLYIGSTATGLSRINDDDHYLSQVILGWWMAYVACNSVTMSNVGGWGVDVTMYPMVTAEGAGVAMQIDR